MAESFVPITAADMETLWAVVAKKTAKPVEGIFGPSSVSWRINREAALFLGAGRAALLQLAHPWVAASLDQHSNLRSDPLARFHNTFRVIFTMVFGTLEQALAASRTLYQLHTRIQGEIPETAGVFERGSRYSANELDALRWVYATLAESAVLAYETVLPSLLLVEKESYLAESKTFAMLFGIPPEALPADWAAFEAYNRAMWESNTLAVNALSREMAHRILHGRGSWVPVPRWYCALTAAWMPERLRQEFELPFGKAEADRVARARAWLPRVYRKIPSPLRYVGPYHEACARLRNREIGPVTRASNRFWMGQSRMLFQNAKRPDLPPS